MTEVDNRTLEKARELEEQEFDRKTYRALKRDLIGVEEENTEEIIMQKCAGKGDWFEIADSSALIYYYYVCQVLKVKNVRFEDDYDSFYEQYKIGRIRTRGTDTVRERLKKVNMYGGEHVIHGRLVFMLKKPFTRDRMKQLREKEARRRLMLNRTVLVEHSDPLFYRDLSEMIKRFHRICSSKLDKLSSQTNGARMITLMDETMADYLHSTELSKKNIDERIEDWKNIRKKLYRLKYEIQIIEIAGLWSLEVCVRAFDMVTQLKKLADKNLVKVMKEKEEQGNEETKATT
ncbi:hypothetical protein IKF89_03195 [Candidatus Saccharibacteria bacterium]|nr:hypothetical protein [Candidatus Saccharibacteria bacterium]